ncbi:hypothetical protein BX616_005553 [Lobosporangium transversale]|nr:hypothetical protein BX616_005553 [Lobosporangium transversale]
MARSICEESDSDWDSWIVDSNDYSNEASGSDSEIELDPPIPLLEATSIHPSADVGIGESSLMPDGSESSELDERVFAKPDGRSKYFYFQTYECHRNHDSRGQNRAQTALQDVPQDIPQEPEQEQRQKKRRRVFKKSQKVGCTAKLIVHNMKDDSGDPELAMKGGKKQLRITYYYRHTGHVLGDPNDFQYLTMSESTKTRIRNLVCLGLSTRGIIVKINLAGPQAYSHHKQGRVQRDSVLTYDDVYNIYYTHISALTKLSDNDMDSMKLWMSKLQQEKQFTIFTKSFTMDMVGAPEFITTDDAQVEYKAIRKAFGQEVTIHLWHVMKSWARKLSTLIRGADKNQSKELRQSATNDLRSILYDPAFRSAGEKIVEFEKKWSEHNEGKLWEYLQERYFIEGRRQRWMKPYCVGKFYAGMDTNNYVESWHNHLKSHFLRGHTNCRGDRLIYLLSHDVDDFYQALAMRSVVRHGRHSKGEKLDILQERCLDNKSIEDLRDLVIYVEGHYCVISPTTGRGMYNVRVDESNTITGCNCQFFISKRRPCMHMLVLFKVKQNDEERPLSLPKKVMPLVMDKHLTVEHGEYQIEEESGLNQAEALLEEDQQSEETDELLELIKKFLQNSDIIDRSKETVGKLKHVVNTLDSVPIIPNTSGTKKRQRQCYKKN